MEKILIVVITAMVFTMIFAMYGFVGIGAVIGQAIGVFFNS